MINVEIDEDTAIQMLCDRVDVWREPNSPEAKLYYKMYEDYIYGGCFDGAEFDVMSIVDNDIVNWCDTIEPDNKDFKKLLRLWKKGERDVSCEEFKEGSYSFIEAVSDEEDLILIRW